MRHVDTITVSWFMDLIVLFYSLNRSYTERLRCGLQGKGHMTWQSHVKSSIGWFFGSLSARLFFDQASLRMFLSQFFKFGPVLKPNDQLSCGKTGSRVTTTLIIGPRTFPVRSQRWGSHDQHDQLKLCCADKIIYRFVALWLIPAQLVDS